MFEAVSHDNTSQSKMQAHRTQSNKEHAEIEALQAKEADEIALKLRMKQEEERVQAEEAARAAEEQTQAESNTVVTEVTHIMPSCTYSLLPGRAHLCRGV